MVRQRDSGPSGTGRSSAIQKLKKKNRHYHDRDRPYFPTTSLVARPAPPKSKHKTILEWTENTEKKKKLEIEVTTNKNPNANFSFVPIGNPELTALCKELSREQDALVYIVSTTREKGTDLSDHVHRIGYHFRTHIVEQATSMVEGLHPIDLASQEITPTGSGDKPDPIPESQEEINRQADAAIRDLFPRIPNTDRAMIILHAFQKGAVFNGKPVVGLQADLSLSRRVQLAVSAHIRHSHTRYDQLLKETSWENARKAVESLCLDTLVKWRGDEETGRDQLDEVLREIVVIDDSDEEDNESEEESESENEEEEEKNSDITADGAAEVNLDATNATSTLPQKLPQSTQPSKAQINSNPLSTHPINPLNKTPGVASRTRSKTKPKKTKKSRRRNKSYQAAWQDALKRRLERHSAPKTPLEPPSRNIVREVDESRRLMQNRTPVEHTSLDLYTAPYDNVYQAIYAIEGSRGADRPVKPLTSPQRIYDPSSFNYRENMLMSPQTHNMASLEYRQGYDSRPPNRILPTSHNIRPQQGFTQSRSDVPPQDMALPSIEQTMDLVSRSPTRINSYDPTRHSQVTYQEIESERRFPPTYTNITYVDSWEDNQPKRRRLVLADDQSHVSISSSAAHSFAPLIPITIVEQPVIKAPPLRRPVEVRNNRDQYDVPTVIDCSLDYPNYTQRVTDARDQNSFPLMTEFRGSTSTDPGRHIINDDSPPRMRMVRRAPGVSYPNPEDLHTPEPQLRKIQRVGDQLFFDTPRPIQSMQAPFSKNKPVDPNQSVQPTKYPHAPSNYQQGATQDSSTSLSAFPNPPHSHKINSSLVSYPILSRPHYEHESRFSSNRDDPILVGTKSSHQSPQVYFTARSLERIGPQSRENNHRPIGFKEAPQVERRYVPIDSQDRIQQTEQQYFPINSQDMARRFERHRPTSASGLNNPPYQDEVIVLSP